MSAFDLSRLDEFLLRQIVRKLSFRSGPKFYRSCRGAKEFVDGVNPDWLPPEPSRYHIVIRGDLPLVLLDVQTFNWKYLSITMPYRTLFMGGAFLNGELYVFGGKDGRALPIDGPNLSTTVAYKLKKNLEWEQLPNMSEGRSEISESCVVYKGCIWVMGGWTDGGCTRTVEAYGPTSNSWITKPPMNYRRLNPGAAVFHGKIFVCGGLEHTTMKPSTVEYFDDQLSRWIDCSPVPVWLSSSALVLGSNLVIAGWNGDTSEVWCMDVGEANPRLTKMSSTTFRIHFGRMLGGKLLAVGDPCCWRDRLSYAEIFDGKTWNLVPDLPDLLQYGPLTSISREMAQKLCEKEAELKVKKAKLVLQKVLDKGFVSETWMLELQKMQRVHNKMKTILSPRNFLMADLSQRIQDVAIRLRRFDLNLQFSRLIIRPYLYLLFFFSDELAFRHYLSDGDPKRTTRLLLAAADEPIEGGIVEAYQLASDGAWISPRPAFSRLIDGRLHVYKMALLVEQRRSASPCLSNLCPRLVLLVLYLPAIVPPTPILPLHV